MLVVVAVRGGCSRRGEATLGWACVGRAGYGYGSGWAARAGEAGREVSVLHVQETHELWSRLAVNEEEGQVAVGHVDGKVSVYYYAPPA